MKISAKHLYAEQARTAKHGGWGGLSSVGYQTPYDSTSVATHDLFGDNKGNQAQPLLLPNKGRYVWSEQPFMYGFDKGAIGVSTREGKICSGQKGSNLRDAYPPGVLMIDDNWQGDYGTLEFSARCFRNPKGMMEELHKLGFKVMFWICPFVSPDSTDFRFLAKERMLLLDPQKSQEILWANTRNKAAIVRWWNGASACLDLSNPKAIKWFRERLDYLVNEYGVDGFKFDAGDANFYTGGLASFKPDILPNDHTTFFAEVGLRYPLNEYRAGQGGLNNRRAHRQADRVGFP